MGDMLKNLSNYKKVRDINLTKEDLIMFEKQCEKRLVYYKKSNHDIHLYKMDGTKEKIEKRKRNNVSKKKLVNDYLFDD